MTADKPQFCECCQASPKPGKALCRDHNHDTGLFRGWLCHSCNLGIGLLGDDLLGVTAAARYLRRAAKHDASNTTSPSKRVAAMLARLEQSKGLRVSLIHAPTDSVT